MLKRTAVLLAVILVQAVLVAAALLPEPECFPCVR